MFAATMRPSTLCDVCQPRVCLFVLRLLRSFACRSHGLPTFIVFLFSIVYMYWPWCVRLAIFDFCAFRITKLVTCNVCTIFVDWSIGRTTIEHRVRLAFLRRRMSSFASLLCVKLFIVWCVCIIFHRACGACSIRQIHTMRYSMRCLSFFLERHDQGLEYIFIQFLIILH